MSTVARPREQYARTWVKEGELEISIGLEYKDDENVEEITQWLKELGNLQFARRAAGAIAAVEAVGGIEAAIRAKFGGRAYFIETERDGRGIQVFQPYGLPRNPGGELPDK